MKIDRQLVAAEVLTQEDLLARVPELAIESALVPAVAPAPESVRGEAAAPDVPAAVGVMIAASYAAIMGGFVVTFAHSTEATFMVVISVLYTVIYLAIPAIFLRVEPATGRVTLAQFMRHGLHTWTGHLSGREALVQMLTVPVAIALAVAGIGTVVGLSG